MVGKFSLLSFLFAFAILLNSCYAGGLIGFASSFPFPLLPPTLIFVQIWNIQISERTIQMPTYMSYNDLGLRFNLYQVEGDEKIDKSSMLRIQ
jgi:uncharacterized membrane protein AbrB (regulator of aidB expression)